MKVTIAFKSKVLCVTKRHILSFIKGKLFLIDFETKKIIQGCKIKNVLSKLQQRLLRLEPRIAQPIDDENFLLSFNGHMLRYNIITNECCIEQEYNNGMKNPLHICSMINKNGEKEFYYGEYIFGIEKKARFQYIEEDKINGR